ncbi:MAG: hypothetical protein FWH06_07095, partial [Oscillospiraceae bacterium]|nr:hypothetical protein [Oscillospiraceae bacterium]
FVFVNNYQRGYGMAEHKNVILKIQVGHKTIETTPMDIKNGDYFFYPFNMPVHGGVIKWATATPLCSDGTTTVFYGGKDAVFITEGSPDYRLISREDAKNAYRHDGRLVVSEFPIIENGGGWVKITSESVEGCCELCELSEGKYSVKLKYPKCGGSWFLRVDYRGESAKAFAGAELIADDFYAGRPWTIGLNGLGGLPDEIRLEIETLREGDNIYLEKWPEMENGRINRVDAVSVTRELKVSL